jgi:toxin ParE1/3/4
LSLEIRLTEAAEGQLADVLAYSGGKHGDLRRRRYQVLIRTALLDLAADPGRHNVRIVNGRLHYHIRHSRDRVPTPPGKVGDPRHIIIAKVVGPVLFVLAFAHDSMVEELRKRAAAGEGQLW